MNFPKVLIISNNCFSLSSNNGRTLGNFFNGWPQDKLAQFYIKPEIPQEDICSNYLCVSDKMVLDLLMMRKNTESGSETAEKSSTEEGKPVSKNAFTMLIRYMIWRIARWRKCYGFDKFVDAFAPEIVLLQAGDTPSMYDLARSISEKRNIPLVIYNSEDHVLRKHNYFPHSLLGKLTYPIFHHILNGSFVKTLKRSSYVVYISDKLQKEYQKLYSHNSSVIYTSTNVTANKQNHCNDPLKISYFGNLDFERYISLVDIANAFSAEDSRTVVDVYGKITAPEIHDALVNCKSICTHGFVPYEVIRDVIKNSDVLLHTESFSDSFQRINSNYFSTKIADCLASGKSFFAYAPGHIAFMEYLSENKAAILANKPEKLRETVANIVMSEEFRTQYVEKALWLANENHNFEKNKEKVQSILIKLYGESAD